MRTPQTRFLSAAVPAVLLAGMVWSGCIEQTPLSLPTDDVCGAPDPGDTTIGETSVDMAALDTPAVDTSAEDTPHTMPDTTPDVCSPDCDGKGCGEPDGCDGFCPGNCDLDWVCDPAVMDCVPGDCVDDGGAFEVTFPDPVLEARVNAALGTTDETAFTYDDIKDLVVLDANVKATDGPIGDLTGLGCLVNLEVLWIAGNGAAQPADFTMDISPMVYLKALTHLDLEDNRVASIEPLLELPNLLLLDLGGNDIGDAKAAPLANAAFKHGLLALDISTNDLPALPNLQLYEALRILDITGNRISDLSSLADAAFKDKLVILHADENRSLDDPEVTGITSLAGLKGYFAQAAGPVPDALANYIQDWRNKLTLYTNRLDSLDGLETMSALQVLEAADNQLTDLAPIQDLGDLTKLGVSGNEIADLPADMETWPSVPPLVELDISWNPLQNHMLIGYFTTLESLNLEMTVLEDLNFMTEWGVLGLTPPIRWLNISTNPFIFGVVEGSPLFPLAEVGMTLEVLVAEGIFTATPSTNLTELWLPDAALVAITELHLALNELKGENIFLFSNTTEGIWATLKKLYLTDNQIEAGLVNLTPLVEKALPLQALDLSGNTIAACADPDEDWLAVCLFTTQIQTFLPPDGCEPCP